MFWSSARALRFMKASIAVILALTTSLFGQSPPQKHPFTFEDMMKLKRVGAPVPSPDGKWVLFDAEDVDLEANTRISHLWIVPATGGESRRLNPTSNHEERPRFSPDGKRLIWTSKATDPMQIWMCDFETESGRLEGTPRQLTTISTGADGGIWSPDGKNILFVSAVYPDCKDDACNKERDEELKKSKVKAKIFTRLFYRHWNAFTEFKRSHLFVVSADASVGRDSVEPNTQSSVARQSVALPRDLTPGDHDVPPFHLGGQDMYAISPDGQELAYTSNIDEVEATSTNNEIFVVPVSGGAAKKISTSPGADTTPLYSPDGKYLAWRSQARAGFESDRQTLIVYERASGKMEDALAIYNDSGTSFTSRAHPQLRKMEDVRSRYIHSVTSFTWRANPLVVYLGVEYAGGTQLFFAQPGVGFGPFSDPLSTTPSNTDNPYHRDDFVSAGDSIYFSRNGVQSPSEIWRTLAPTGEYMAMEPGQRTFPVTHMNDALLSTIDMQPLESFTFKGANDEEVQGFMVKPPGFDPSKKYPLKFLIHGGPQGAWGNSWSYRWNPELFAANGYVVVMINFHGSTGYGQEFTDSVSGDWGGKPYIDLMKGLDYVEKTYPFIDKDREAALGASYGGWMANWLLGHTDRFKCIVSHDGMFNTESAWGTTEELWFPEWEFKGPPWKQRELYRKFSPHLFADKFKTPTLVVHGQNDYRLDVSEGFQLFTTLQRLKVPSKMLYFPDEGHWVLKPQNSRLWYKTVNDWVDQWCGR
jgi:dipeptidyl aminopeptidase/acylaminoacyl peptidase